MSNRKNLSGSAVIVVVLLFFPLFIAAQKIAVLTPEKDAQSEKFAELFEAALAQKFRVLDASMSETAFLSVNVEKPFNLTTDEAKIIGAAIGCDYFLLVKAQNQRRFSFAKNEYFESYAVIYVVSSRTGRLVFWKLQSLDSVDPQTSEKLLFESAADLTKEIFEQIVSITKNEFGEKPKPNLEEIPDEKSPAAKNFRPPLPFKRISPPYTATAALYQISATVDIEVDLDENGQVLHTEILRWAGFGLDEAVTQTIRKMNWRPAERDKKTLPMRILLRYNFKKIEKEEE